MLVEIVEFDRQAADAAYAKWRRTDLAQRAELLQRIADSHREHAEELATLMTTEMGKTVAQARDGRPQTNCDACRRCCGEALR
jgi:acyl-CoA reductase-like NAD-dependent aldehyde dehydrogenase